MKALKDISISEFKYDLPEEKIALKPLANRDQSKLLIYRRGEIHHGVFKELAKEIPENNLLIRNNTKVIQARLIFSKSTGAKIEVFCLEPSNPADYERSFSHQGPVDWLCLVGNAKKWKSGVLVKKIKQDGYELTLSAELIKRDDNNTIVRFSWTDYNLSFGDILEKAGSTPIPPYLNRKAEDRDKRWYQTIYAANNGSVAAPTAGLHFTENVFTTLKDKNIEIQEVTLHVGAGTFRPVQSEKIADHDMHSEAIVVSEETINQIIKKLDDGITAVGTTSLRTIESLYWLGNSIADKTDKEDDILFVDQWEPYRDEETINAADSLQNILLYLKLKNLGEIKFHTRLIIVPGYKFRLASRLITNFHQPGSTLLLLVGAFIGDDWRKVYNYALENDFRFLSYGDSSILELNNNL